LGLAATASGGAGAAEVGLTAVEAGALAVGVGLAADALPALTTAAVRDWARRCDLTTVVVPYAPIGPSRTALDLVAAAIVTDGIALVPVRRAWDSAAWPAARRGYFAFREGAGTLIG